MACHAAPMRPAWRVMRPQCGLHGVSCGPHAACMTRQAAATRPTWRAMQPPAQDAPECLRPQSPAPTAATAASEQIGGTYRHA
eukprot:365119-Chlamydomonas_euryale.AAC.3